MKKILIGLLALGSMSSFAKGLGSESDFCKNKKVLIEQIEESNSLAAYLDGYSSGCDEVSGECDGYLDGYGTTKEKVLRKGQEGFALKSAIRTYCKD